MNVKLAWEIGWKLGMAKRAGGVYGKLMEPVRAPMKQTLGAISKATVGPSGGAGVTPAIAAKQKAEADTLAKAGPLSLDSDDGSDDWDEKSPLSLDSVGGSAAQGGQATHLRNMQLYGVDAANRMKAGGGQPGQGNDFWSLNPEQGRQATGDMFNKFLGFNSPSQYTAWQQARASGMGRALRARANNQWIRSMFAE